MIRKRRTKIIAAIAALLVITGAVIIGFTVHDDDVAKDANHVVSPVPLAPELAGDKHATETPTHRRHDYGQGYESRQGQPSPESTPVDPGKTDSSKRPPMENAP
jgi:hypothetical protein